MHFKKFYSSSHAGIVHCLLQAPPFSYHTTAKISAVWQIQTSDVHIFFKNSIFMNTEFFDRILLFSCIIYHILYFDVFLYAYMAHIVYYKEDLYALQDGFCVTLLAPDVCA